MTTLDLDSMIITEPGVYAEIPNGVYHADPVLQGSLSHSGAKKMLAPYCPAIYKWETEHPVRKRIFDIGSAVHKLVLGEGEEIAVIDYASYQTAKAQQQQEEAYLAGQIPILSKEFVEVQAMAEAVLSNPIARSLFNPERGLAEQSLFWQHDNGSWLRARLDWMPKPHAGRFVLADLKTSVSADPTTFAKSAADLRYHSQAAWYKTGVRALGLTEDPAFVFVVVEKKPPYLVSVIELDDTAEAIGHNLNRWAIDLWTECRKNDRWPSYSDDVVLQPLPAWYTRQYDED